MPLSPENLPWTPGSFTKNFSWGRGNGLKALYEHIRVGFGETLEDVPRDVYINRTRSIRRPFQIPTNFFLMNVVKDGVSFLVVDELVFQALTQDHSPLFDRLAITALNLSFAGTWIGQRRGQRRPALWAHFYVKEVIAKQLRWNTSASNARRIESFIKSSPNYTGEGADKVSTNLNFIYEIAKLGALGQSRVERWWVDAFFLALDRTTDDLSIDGKVLNPAQFSEALVESQFFSVTGDYGIEKQLATKHLAVLYAACGGRARFKEEQVKEYQALQLPDIQWLIANDPRPQGAVHGTNPNIIKSIPRACAVLAKYLANYEIIGADELATFDPEEFVRRRTRAALANLKQSGVKPKMSAEELERITRER